MQAYDFMGFLGWLTVISFSIALSQYFLKRIHKKYIVKLSGKYKVFVLRYRWVMKWVIKIHPIAGLIAAVSVLLHFLIAFTSGVLVTSGIIAAIIMACLVIMGIVGAKVYKGKKGTWLLVHRVLAFALIVAIINHI